MEHESKWCNFGRVTSSILQKSNSHQCTSENVDGVVLPPPPPPPRTVARVTGALFILQRRPVFFNPVSVLV